MSNQLHDMQGRLLETLVAVEGHGKYHTSAYDGPVMTVNDGMAALTHLIEAYAGAGFEGGFYAGQAMAGVELYDCHDNWKRYNKTPPKQQLKSKKIK